MQNDTAVIYTHGMEAWHAKFCVVSGAGFVQERTHALVMRIACACRKNATQW